MRISIWCIDNISLDTMSLGVFAVHQIGIYEGGETPLLEKGMVGDHVLLIFR